MANTRLLRTICTVAALAAAPAFAQTNLPTGDTGAGGAPNNPTNVTPSPSETGSAPAPGSHADMDHHSTHRSAMMGHPHGAMHARNDLSQDAAVNRLNDQSYQAARGGQSYGGGSGDLPAGPGSSAGAAGDSK